MKQKIRKFDTKLYDRIKALEAEKRPKNFVEKIKLSEEQDIVREIRISFFEHFKQELIE